MSGETRVEYRVVGTQPDGSGDTFATGPIGTYDLALRRAVASGLVNPRVERRAITVSTWGVA